MTKLTFYCKCKVVYCKCCSNIEVNLICEINISYKYCSETKYKQWSANCTQENLALDTSTQCILQSHHKNHNKRCGSLRQCLPMSCAPVTTLHMSLKTPRLCPLRPFRFVLFIFPHFSIPSLTLSSHSSVSHPPWTGLITAHCKNISIHICYTVSMDETGYTGSTVFMATGWQP